MPARIGRYEVKGAAGRGGSGTVYRAVDPDTGQEVAIKTCASRDEETRRRFLRQAKVASALQHPSIARILEVGVEDDAVHLVQEYLPGEDLLETIRRREPIPLDSKVAWLLQVAEGLAHAHAQGVVHRDVKPGNVRIGDDGRARILDFGIAALPSASSTGRKLLGTAGYVAPERIRGHPADRRSDVFSFGALAYELLAYRRAFEGDEPSEVLEQVLSQEPTPLAEVLPGCPPSLAALVAGCLAKDPAERLRSFDSIVPELRLLLRELHAQAPVEATAPSAEPLPGGSPPRPEDTRPLPEILDAPAEDEWEPAAPPELAEPPGEEPAAEEDSDEPTVVTPPPSTGRRRRLAPALGALAVVAVLVAAVLAWWLAGRDGRVVPEAAQPAAEGPAPAAPGTALLSVVATPWAEVVEVRDASGAPIELPPAAFTPLGLPVAPGRYTVTLAHPDLEEPRICRVEVRPGTGAACRVEIEPPAVSEYFAEHGWWR